MRDMSEYVLGGRRLSSITAALSAGSSTTSAWTMLALPALAFTNGAVEIWVPVAIVVGMWLSWTFTAGRLRRYTIAAGDTLTIPEFLEVRFGDRTSVIRTTAALITIPVRGVLRELRAGGRREIAGNDIRTPVRYRRHPDPGCHRVLHP